MQTKLQAGTAFATTGAARPSVYFCTSAPDFCGSALVRSVDFLYASRKARTVSGCSAANDLRTTIKVRGYTVSLPLIFAYSTWKSIARITDASLMEATVAN